MTEDKPHQPGIAQSATLLQLLREHTRAEHIQTENSMPVLRPEFSPTDYERLLKGIYGFYAVFEPAVRARIAHFGLALDWDRREKLDLLAADLLGFGHGPAALAQLPKLRRLPPLETVGHVMGALYVTEGSTLGGAVINRHLQTKFTDTPYSFKYFRSYGIQIGPMWRNFLQTMDAVVPASQFPDALHSARENFITFRTWLT